MDVDAKVTVVSARGFPPKPRGMFSSKFSNAAPAYNLYHVLAFFGICRLIVGLSRLINGLSWLINTLELMLILSSVN